MYTTSKESQITCRGEKAKGIKKRMVKGSKAIGAMQKLLKSKRSEDYTEQSQPTHGIVWI